MGAKTRVVDLGWDRIIKEVRKADNSHTKVGFPQRGDVQRPKDAHADDMSDLVVVAAVHEFGAPKANIPVRSFMRTAFDENVSAINRLKEREYGRILDGKSTVKQSLGKIGLFFQNRVQKKIRDLKVPALKASTVARRRNKSNNPLVDTGQLVGSVQHVEVINGARQASDRVLAVEI